MTVFAIVADFFAFFFLFEIFLRKWRAQKFRQITVLLFGSTSLALFFELSIPLTMALFCLGSELLEPILVQRNFAERSKQFDHSLARALVSVATSLRAGLTLREGVKLAAHNDEASLKEEWLYALKETELGDPFDFALAKVSDRIPTWASRMAMKGMALSVSQGGKLPQLLLRIAHTIEETQRVEGRLRALTSQGRTQAILLIGAPPVMGLGMWIYDPEKMSLLFVTAAGQGLFVAAVVLWCLGIYLTKKTLEFEV